MQLEINDNTIIRDIQEGFNKIYPNLWIEFYYHTIAGTNHSRTEKIQPAMTFRNLGYMNGTVFIDLDGNRSVDQLEYDFCEKLGLKTKILRKSGNVWVGTLFTGNWSLTNQNSKGEQVFNE